MEKQELERLAEAKEAEANGMGVITTSRSVWISNVQHYPYRIKQATALAWCELTDPKFWHNWKLDSTQSLRSGAMRFDFSRKGTV